MLLLLIPAQVMVMAYAWQRKRYYALLFATLVVCPLFIGCMQVILYAGLQFKYTCGASGLCAAAIGYTPMVTLKYLDDGAGKLLNLKTLNANLMYMAMAVLMIYLPNPIVIAIASTVLIVTVLVCGREIRTIRDNGKRLFKKNYLVMSLVAFLFTLYLLAPLLIFPTQLVVDGSVVDIVSHLVGLVFGIGVGYAILSKNQKPDEKIWRDVE